MTFLHGLSGLVPTSLARPFRPTLPLSGARALSIGLAALALAACGNGGSTSGSGASTTGGSGGSGASTTGGSGGSGGDSSGGTSSGGTSSGGTGGTGGGGPHLADWVKKFLGSEQTASSVAVDAQGNIYVGGRFSAGSVEFGAGQIDCPMIVGIPNSCGYLLKLDPTGKTLWSRGFVADRTISVDVGAIGVRPDGVVIAASWQRAQLMHKPLDVGTGPLDPPGDNPLVLARFDPDGKALWSAAFGDDMGEVVPRSIVVDGPTSFTVGGGFTTMTLDFGAGAPLPYTSDHTLFLAHFDADKPVWQKSFGGDTGQEMGGFGRGPAGDYLLGGWFATSVDFGGPQPLDGKGTWSIFQADVDSKGGFVSASAFDSTGMVPSVTGAAVDAAGDLLVTGFFDGTLGLGAAPLTCQGDVNGYLAKLDSKGNVVFAQASTGAQMSVDGSYCVGADASNNTLWGEGLFFVDAQGNDLRKGSITKLDPAGKPLWSVQGDNFGPRAFAFGADGSVIAVGEFTTEIDFAKDGPVKATKGRNAFIAKFAP
jgi:hypothetical protein